jgi:3'-phosphoadenosine 5'-phosphosulfate sulfotransferase (PAPS reductase)/FAD synthetase
VIPDVASYDVILVNSSAGKDSQAMLDYLVELCEDASVRSRMVVVHCDLGRVEWEGTRALAEEHADHYGLRFEVVARDRDLLHQVEHERKKWPDAARRYWTSDQKTSQVAKLITRLTSEIRAYRPGHRVRILNCLGLRADESPARAKKPVFSVDKATNGRRHVDRWLPIHAWAASGVWRRIAAAGTRHHPAYDLGMPRLSCCFCVLASRSALVLAAQHNPELADEYVRVEAEIGHSFRKNMTIRSIVEEARATTAVAVVEEWQA